MSEQKNPNDNMEKQIDIEIKPDNRSINTVYDNNVDDFKKNDSKPEDNNQVNLSINNSQEKNNVYKDSFHLTFAHYLTQCQIEKNKEQMFKNIDSHARSKWYDISTNVYEFFVLEANNDPEDTFKNYLDDVFGGNLDEIIDTDHLVDQIREQNNYLDQQEKKLRLNFRNTVNTVIIFFSFLLVGIPFLPIYFKNQKILRNYEKTKINVVNKITQLNREKIKRLDKVYAQFPTINLLNYYLNSFGIRILHELTKTNIHNLVPNNKKDLCVITHVMPFKVGGHVFINYRYCEEWWEEVTTEGSLDWASSDDDYSGPDGDEYDEYSINETEVVHASHVESTPCREWRNRVYTAFDPDPDNYYWDLTSFNFDLKEKENKKNSPFNNETLRDDEMSNNQFNQHYVIGGIKDDDYKTLTTMNSYFTNYSQNIIVKIGEYYNFNKFHAVFTKGNFLANTYFDDYIYNSGWTIDNFLKYHEVDISGSDTINQLKQMLLNCLNELMYTPCFLWATDTGAINMLNFPSNHDWSLGEGYSDDCRYADFETVISYATIEKCIYTSQKNDAFKGKYFYQFRSLEDFEGVDVYFCNLKSYYTKKQVEKVETIADDGSIVHVPVEYVKYYPFTEPKIFLVYKNTTSLVGSFLLTDFQFDEKLMLTLGKKIKSCFLICTPALKIIAVNDEFLQDKYFKVLADFIKTVDSIE